ncbi:MAG: hypothetical protein JSR99_03560 [Proteobacteria bacterium]|nr:hypothetical protein [Pseudomonadota bacterium]
MAYIICIQMKATSLKTTYARDATTALNWADEGDRVLISQSLRAIAQTLAAEILLAKFPEERRHMLVGLSRIYTRLAICDMDAARRVERRLELERRNDTVCRITLEKMADMAYEAAVPDRALARNFLLMMKAFARVLRDEGLCEWFPAGPYAGLGRFAHTAADLDLDTATKEREAFTAVCDMARRIPLHEGVDAEKIEAQVFRDGLALLRRHQGMDKGSRGM